MGKCSRDRTGDQLSAAPQRASFSARRRSCSPRGAACPSMAPEAAGPLRAVHDARRPSRSHRRRRTAGLLPPRSNLIDLVQRTRFESRSDEAGVVVPGPQVKRGWDPSSIERSGRSRRPRLPGQAPQGRCEPLERLFPSTGQSWLTQQTRRWQGSRLGALLRLTVAEDAIAPPARDLEHERPIPGPTV
jgi:hypothetical protein